MSTEKLAIPTTTDNSLPPSIEWYKNSKFYFIFKGSCLKQKKCNFYSSKYDKCFYAYKLDAWSRDLNSDFDLKDCLYEGVKLAKNADPDKYKYSGYDIGFKLRSEF